MKKSQEIHNFTHIVSLEQLKREIEYEFNLVCSKSDLSQLTNKLNVLAAKKACINGTLKLQTANQIFLKGNVTAKLIQPCSLTLEPVITNISKNFVLVLQKNVDWVLKSSQPFGLFFVSIDHF